VKLLGFAALLALVFGVAAVAGGAVGPDRSDDAAKRADTPGGHGEELRGEDGGHGEGAGDDAAGHDADAVRGLSVADDGLRLALADTSLPRGRETTLRFKIEGAEPGDFQVEHEKRMHLIVVRRDGTGFQHLHPEMAADGTWSTPVTLPDAGAYRVFADFKTAENETLAADLTVDGEADYVPLPEPTETNTTDGYRVALSETGGRLAFAISRDGQPVETEPYLGAGGHLVALREGDLAYLHVHPVDGGGVEFETELDPDSRYRLYLQFKHEGQVHTAEFTR
jgi:hypothetical protein